MKVKSSTKTSKAVKDPAGSLPKGPLEAYIFNVLKEAAAKCAFNEAKEIQSAIKIQSAVRSWFVQQTIGYELRGIRLAHRREARERTRERGEHTAATKIQARIKGAHQRQRFAYHLDLREEAAIILQSLVRGFLVRNNCFLRLAIHRREKKKHDAASKLQARFKGMQAREEFGALILEARASASLQAPCQVRVRPRSARPTPHLTTVTAANHTSLENLLVTEPELHLNHADVLLPADPNIAGAGSAKSHTKVRLRPQSAPRLLNPSGLSQSAQMRLYRAHSFCGDLPEMEQQLLSHVDSLRWIGENGENELETPTYVVGEGGEITLEEGIPPPWITPRLTIPSYMIRTGLGGNKPGNKLGKPVTSKTGGKKPPRPKRAKSATAKA
mmetsp:Transcript_10767/g.12634  ORF Transcript_10767/g.12634 Transcript_10767/m.12634 type:complete len:385 (+) Transcript_10767:362-1516(+)|eukprot:CAMPEP_0197858266 /NCGR_PEP_ID=MMETSP1438-20131217/31947_1 /TAXON_ID=1461541 /ORGANISM="Pterosperma sp., Strain CCMP1384" /LENGTH=384 /DNA_ID=CAMNT_0043474371 /DNA_START=356 /DNA_END=1510 /DNA_ORIENTATION=+